MTMYVSPRLFALFVQIISVASIDLHDNGYEGVIVYIADTVSEDSLSLSVVKKWLTEASSTLYRSSHYHVYLRNITIRVPSNWTIGNNYQKVSKTMTKNSKIIIDVPNPLMGNRPYTFGQGRCGHEALYSLFTPDLLNSGNHGNYGNLGKVFTHEWGHLRWGLFDEYPSVTDTNGNDIQYYLEGGNWEPVRCSLSIKGENRRRNTTEQCKLDNTGKPEKNCRFYPSLNTDAVASLMGHSYLPSVHQFCESNTMDLSLRHNRIAHNQQNKRCKGQSSWDVMRNHPDFNGSSPGDPQVDTTPYFTVVKDDLTDKISLVIDVSGSMAGTLYDLAKNAATILIKYIIPDGAYISIVTFSSSATVNHGLVKITSKQTRNDLVKSLPTSVSGDTSIGAGLMAALKTLNNNVDEDGSVIYLMSDGGENEAPYIKDVLPTVVKRKVVVHTLALGQHADPKLKNVSEVTGGKSYFFSTNSVDQSVIIDAVAEPFLDNTNVNIVKIVSSQVKASQNVMFNETFNIDDSIGDRTLIQLTSSQSLLGVKMIITGPNDTEQNVTGTGSTKGVLTLELPGKCKVGQYKISILSPSFDLRGTIVVQSKPVDDVTPIVTINAWTDKSDIKFSATMQFLVYVSVLKGRLPVAGAAVIAVLENESGYKINVTLNDNGIGGDIIANDGIYSAYILSSNIQENGRHSIKFYVKGENSTIMVPISKSTGLDDEEVQLEVEHVSNFERVTLGEELIVQHYYTIPPGDDLIPPSSLQTFSIVRSFENNSYLLSWKAVGDDFDKGTASSYDIRISTNIDELLNEPNDQEKIENDMKPNLPGETELFLVDVPNQKPNVTFYLVVRAIDDKNNTGDNSNVLSLSILTDTAWVSGDSNIAPTAQSTSDKSLTNIFIGIIIAVIVTGLAVVLSILAIRRRRKLDDYFVKEAAYYDNKV